MGSLTKKFFRPMRVRVGVDLEVRKTEISTSVSPNWLVGSP